MTKSYIRNKIWSSLTNRDLLRVADGVGSDAAAEAVNGRAKAMQLYDIKVMSGP